MTPPSPMPNAYGEGPACPCLRSAVDISISILLDGLTLMASIMFLTPVSCGSKVNRPRFVANATVTDNTPGCFIISVSM